MSADDRSGVVFFDISRDVAMATNFVEKWQTPHIRCSGIQKRNGYHYLSVLIDMAKNWRISSNISRYTGPIFANFSSYESTLRAFTLSYFLVWQWTLPWQADDVDGNEKVMKAD